MRNSTKNIIENIPYEKNIKFCDFLNVLTGIGAISSANNSTWIIDCLAAGETNLILLSSCFTLLSSGLTLLSIKVKSNFENNIYLSKDVYPIYIIYQQVLQNYNKLNKEFGLTNPVELCTLLNYCVYGGYLSKNHVFTFEKQTTKDIKSVYGANILAGNGVCRHIASLFKDILDINNFNNDLICVSNLKREEIELLKKKLDYLLNSKSSSDEQITELMKKLEIEEQEYKGCLKHPNHLINFISNDTNSWFLDPTQDALLYRFNDDKKYLSYKYCDTVKIFSKEGRKYFKNDLKNYNKNKFLPCISDEEYERFNKQVLRYCDDNQDILEKFYNENKEAYEEVAYLIKEFKLL